MVDPIALLGQWLAIVALGVAFGLVVKWVVEAYLWIYRYLRNPYRNTWGRR